MEQILQEIQPWLTLYGLKIVAALSILIVGKLIAKGIRSLLAKMLRKSHVEDTLVGFVSTLCYSILLTFVFIAALAQLGIQTASFVAILGAAGLAVGLALQGSLANFAAGSPGRRRQLWRRSGQGQQDFAFDSASRRAGFEGPCSDNRSSCVGRQQCQFRGSPLGQDRRLLGCIFPHERNHQETLRCGRNYHSLPATGCAHPSEQLVLNSSTSSESPPCPPNHRLSLCPALTCNRAASSKA